MEFRADYIEEFEMKFEKIAKRASRLGLPRPTYTTTPVTRRRDWAKNEITNPLGEVAYLEITFTGEAPVLDGHTLVAQLDHVSVPGQTLVRYAPGMEHIDLSWFHDRYTCDHCKTNRQRNTTLVFLTPEEKLIQIGRNCSADFFRSKEMEHLISIFESCRTISEEDEDGGGYGGHRAPKSIELPYFLQLLSWVVDQHGYMSKAKAQQIEDESDGEKGVDTTANRLFNIIHECKEYKKHNPIPTRADLAEFAPRAAEITEMLLELEPKDEFKRTLHLIAKSEWVPFKYLAHMAYSHVMWQKVHAQKNPVVKVERKHFPAAEGAKFKGEIQATVLGCPVVDSQFGALCLLSMQVEDGSVLLWKSGTAPRLKSGDLVKLRGFTVKQHSDYKGSPQTVVTHVKLEELAS